MPDVEALNAWRREFGFFSPENINGAYRTFDSNSRYVYLSGLMQVPVAATVGRSRFVRLHAPMSQRVYVWTVEREGKKPMLPSPESGDANEVLIDAVIEPSPPEIDASLQLVSYRVSGVYTYGLLEPRLHLNTLRMGASPALSIPASQLTYGPSDFSKTIQGGDGAQFLGR